MADVRQDDSVAGPSPSAAGTASSVADTVSNAADPGLSVVRRFDPLDVLRGLAVLGMALSGLVPYKGLPAWMYHAQLPPPDRNFNDQVYGITWVDLVFPFFLFSMGAAIPLALSRRLDGGGSVARTIGSLLGRGLLLAAYALIGQDLRPFVLASAPGMKEWLITLAGFFIIGLILIRWPARVGRIWRMGLTALGWIGAAAIILTWTYPDGAKGFSNYRSDIILMVLANVAVSGGVVWILTRFNPRARWICFGVVAAIFLTQDRPGLSQQIWNWDPTTYLPIRTGPYARFLPIFYHFEFHKYLLVVLPGTFVGDLILRYLKPGGASATGRSPASSTATRAVSYAREDFAKLMLAAVGPIAILIACAGLLAREVILTTVALGLLVSFTAWAVSASTLAKAGLAAQMFRFGAPLLIIGLLCEPLGGGIRKDEPTFSYFLVTTALASLFLASLTVSWRAVSGLGLWRGLANVGTNPIMGYLVITNLTWAIVGLSGAEDWVNGHVTDPWLQVVWASVKTLFIAFATAWFTRRKIFLRA